MIYVAGSLRNPKIPGIARDLAKATGHRVFSDWFAAGPEADDHWKYYYEAMAPKDMSAAEKYKWALEQPASINTFNFDERHIKSSDLMVLVLPAGKSGHLELGWFLGQNRPGIILLDDTDVRWDVMYQYATGVVTNFDELVESVIHYVGDKRNDFVLKYEA